VQANLKCLAQHESSVLAAQHHNVVDRKNSLYPTPGQRRSDEDGDRSALERLMEHAHAFAGLKFAIDRGWLELHDSGTFVRFTGSSGRTSRTSRAEGSTWQEIGH
jgi:hypothetical protein